ncbi:class I SAM-dependent methyltransferase [Oculatella sp. LEGE 06141]|uniref:TylF/MycF/NovP-related O-methyltransferase n=1 Tax=Oculatella sp. LEGE 06141 TaxID=1828648 RepID=UPI001880EA2D|nr:TylF/MycF/NovP-related O-methyltransferase [Oculatella sp. LEGE 06141]MBE9178701.1 class I SAM-dependent methyltransferase [Oculatella sp. LEGE 06141]
MQDYSPKAIASLIEQVRSHTLLSEGRLKNLIRICQYLNNQRIEGDIVECGAFKGGSAAVLSQFMGDRRLWLYEGFQGMPQTTERDGEDAKQYIGECAASPNDVHEVMQRVGTSSERYIIKAGWFSDTFQEDGPTKVALLHCDADWYSSVTEVLEKFYPLVPNGGCTVLDDFGYWEGCREAFYDFCVRHSEKPLLERIETDQAYWVKGKTSNRQAIAEFYQSLDAPNPVTAEVEQMHRELKQVRNRLKRAESRVDAMESSKFWWLRSQWMRLKSRFSS